MIALRDLQQRCYDAFVMGDAPGLLPFVVDDHIPAAARVQVYQNNAREGFIKTLATSYPVVEQLVGSDCFRTLAQDYARRYPSVSGDLGDFGDRFATLLDAMYDGGEFSYLADVARVEWLCELARSAADADVADLVALQQQAGEAFAEMQFELHPAARLFASSYPVFSIWRAHQTEVVESVDMRVGAEQLLVMRRDGEVELQLLASAEFALLRSLAEGMPLLAAVDAVVATHDDGAAIAALQRIAGLGVLSKVLATNTAANTRI